MILNFPWKRVLIFVGVPLGVVLASAATGNALGMESRSVQGLIVIGLMGFVSLAVLGVFGNRLSRRRQRLAAERGAAVLADLRLEESAFRGFALAAGELDALPRSGTFALTARPGELLLWASGDASTPLLTVPTAAIVAVDPPHAAAATTGAELEFTFAGEESRPTLALIVGSWGGLFLRRDDFERILSEIRVAVGIQT